MKKFKKLNLGIIITILFFIVIFFVGIFISNGQNSSILIKKENIESIYLQDKQKSININKKLSKEYIDYKGISLKIDFNEDINNYNLLKIKGYKGSNHIYFHNRYCYKGNIICKNKSYKFKKIYSNNDITFFLKNVIYNDFQDNKLYDYNNYESVYRTLFFNENFKTSYLNNSEFFNSNYLPLLYSSYSYIKKYNIIQVVLILLIIIFILNFFILKNKKYFKNHILLLFVVGFILLLFFITNNNYFILVSLILYLFSIFFYKKSNYTFIIYILFLLLFIFLSLLFVISDFYTGNGINNSVLYHISYLYSGIGLTGVDIDYSLYVKILLIFFVGLMLIILLLKGYKSNKVVLKYNYIGFLLLFISFLINPSSISFYKNIIKHEKVDSISNVKFEDNFVIPKQINTKKSKNIIWIYLESFENLYLDENIFPGLANGLSELKDKNISFNNIVQTKNVGWTIAGMVGSQCGIPLEGAGYNFNPNNGNTKFLPGALCIGDILNKNGYDLTYLGGSNSKFGGKDNFYKTHGFQEILGIDLLTNKNKASDYINDWGLYDDSLFDYAFEEYEKLSNSSKKYGLFMLTLDTHGRKGFVSDSCKNKRYTEDNRFILNSYHCSDQLATDFINKIINSKNFKDTIIVVTSDHLAMNVNNSYDILNKHKADRKNLFFIIDSDDREAKKIDKAGSVLDIGPTVLNKLGFNIRGLGLGKNLSGTEKTLVELTKYHKSLIKNWTNYLLLFWNENVDLDIKNTYDNKRIAHAGGNYNGENYTNSIDALNTNKDFFKYFEIDFSWTSDNELVCVHDWKNLFKRNFGFDLKGSIPNYETFKKYINNNEKFDNCTLESLIKWLDDNKGKSIVTDIKSDNLRALKLIKNKYPKYIDRFIIQMYNPDNYEQIKELGYKNIIWTLYMYSGKNEEVLDNVKIMNLFAVTMNKKRTGSGLGLELQKLGIYTYIHTINTSKEFEKYKNMGINEVYTDKTILD